MKELNHQNVKQRIEADLKTAFEKANIDPATATVSVSTIDICDYQCNACFALGKTLKKPPLDIARTIASNFKSKVAQCSAVAPAFLNFIVTDATLEDEAKWILQNQQLPLAKQQTRTIFFDYGGANIAKELHVGHLRSPIVGESLKRVFRAFGHKTISDVYLGDWGLQNGLILAELELQGYIDSGEFVKPISLDTLNQVYPLASKKKSTDPLFKERADQLTLLVQQKALPWYSLWKTMRDISVSKIKENYNALGCTFDFYRGESDAQPYINTVLDILKEKKLAYDNDGCLIMDVATENDSAPTPPIILKKYNGGDLYATNDVATLYYRTKEFAPDEFIYLTDARQELHFKQVFRCAKLGGITAENTKLTHIGYGTMNGTDGKPFKTRAGGTVKFEEVINLVTEAANGNPKIGLAALKFADLSNHVKKDYIFDIEKFTAFEGKTGPYILYTIARINSIFSKFENPTLNIKCTNAERDIIIKVLKLADSYSTATVNYTLNGIVDAAFTLASAFNLFYTSHNILREQDKTRQQSYLALCKLVQKTLITVMDTLAIETVDKM